VDETLAEMAQWQKGPHRLKLPADEPKTSTASLFKLLKNLVLSIPSFSDHINLALFLMENGFLGWQRT